MPTLNLNDVWIKGNLCPIWTFFIILISDIIYIIFICTNSILFYMFLKIIIIMQYILYSSQHM